MTTCRRCPHCKLLIGAPLVSEPVIVLPLEKWRRLVHLILHEESDTRVDFDKVEAEVRAIIASVEVPDA